VPLFLGSSQAKQSSSGDMGPKWHTYEREKVHFFAFPTLV